MPHIFDEQMPYIYYMQPVPLTAQRHHILGSQFDTVFCRNVFPGQEELADSSE